jgi:hypothetical protein
LRLWLCGYDVLKVASVPLVVPAELVAEMR